MSKPNLNAISLTRIPLLSYNLGASKPSALIISPKTFTLVASNKFKTIKIKYIEF